MLNTDANTLQGLAQLSPSVRTLLENELLLSLERLIDADGPIMYRLQGRARFLKELLSLVESADKPRPPAVQTLRRG